MNPLQFRCTGCGNCCRSLRVAVTRTDVARLSAATGAHARELVDWLSPDAVDMTGEPQSFVELSEGRRLMVLAQRDGACRLLGAGERCSVYAARPLDCRAFPFDLGLATESGPRRLKLLPLSGCDHGVDGSNDLREIEATDGQRWQELVAYQTVVARWNRFARHRRRLHRSVGSASEFLDFCGK